jgi:hypothetical protein
MASGFIVLPDGRCLARRWCAHDAVVSAVADEVAAAPLRQWLFEQLPGPDDDEELGYGAWFRESDKTTVMRFFDLRLMTSENQRLFCDAAKRAASLSREEDWLTRCLSDLADMISRMESGEPPLSKSDWIDVIPPEGDRIGPGWPDEH